MDTKVWGPLIWRVLEDIAWSVDSRPQPLDQDLGNKVLDFFYSLRCALPCQYCRESYTQFFDQTPIAPAFRSQQMLRWVWQLHEMVNDKLDRQQKERVEQGLEAVVETKVRLSFDKLEKRMMAWTQASSASTLWDVMFLVVYNMPTLCSPEDQQRKRSIQLFLTTLPVLLTRVPACVSAEKLLLAKLMATEPVTFDQPSLRDYWLHWLYRIRQRYDRELGWGCTPSFDKLISRYVVAMA